MSPARHCGEAEVTTRGPYKIATRPGGKASVKHMQGDYPGSNVLLESWLCGTCLSFRVC